MEIKSKVYIQTDEAGRILRCEGGYTTPTDLTGWIKIDEGTGDRYNLCQSHYFYKLHTEDGIPRYRWDGTAAAERSEEEIAADRSKIAIEPTTEEVLLELAADHEARICEIELGVN